MFELHDKQHHHCLRHSRCSTYSHALPPRHSTQWPQRSERSHGTKCWNVSGTGHYGAQINQRELFAKRIRTVIENGKIILLNIFGVSLESRLELSVR